MIEKKVNIRQKDGLWTSLLFAVVLLGMVGCKSSEEALGAGSVPVDPTYSDVAVIIQNRCGICHVGGGVEPALGGFAVFSGQAHASRELMETGEMPPGGPMVPSYERQLIANWIDQGMPR